MNIIIFGYKPKEMKKLLLLSTFYLLSVVGLNAQTWKHKVKYSDFDGKYDIVYANGYGGSYPYEDPQFIIRNDGADELFISDLGYTGCDNNSLLIVFDRSRRYRIYGGPSTDNEAFFLYKYYEDGTGEELTKYHLLMEIMKSSRMSIRFENDCKRNDFYYRLDGSTSALTKMFGRKIQNEVKTFEEDKVKMAIAEKERARLRAIMDSLDKIEADSLRIWRAKVIQERKIVSDSIINYFLTSPSIDGAKGNYVITDESKRKVTSVMERNLKSLKLDQELILFDLSPTNQGYYKLMMIYRDNNDKVQSKFLYKSFRLTDTGELIVY